MGIEKKKEKEHGGIRFGGQRKKKKKRGKTHLPIARQGSIELGMGQLALRAFRAEATDIERTRGPLDVLVLASRAMATEPPVVPGTLLQPGVGIHMQIRTILSIAALAIAGEEFTFGHLGEVVLVEEPTLTSLLAQPTQPVLAHQLSFHLHVPVRAILPLGAGSPQEELADFIYERLKRKKINEKKRKEKKRKK